jgi:hypothetical protein
MSPGAPKVVWGRGSTLIYEECDSLGEVPSTLYCLAPFKRRPPLPERPEAPLTIIRIPEPLKVLAWP